MFKFIIFIVAAFLLYKLVVGDKKKKSVNKKKQEEKLHATGEMIKDPICGSYVPKDAEIRVRDGETVHAFCSYECRDKYLKQLESSGASQDAEQNSEDETEAQG
jgi:YHS domain-containing protein